MDESAVRKLLRRQCEDAGSQAAWAARSGVSVQYVGDVLAGRRRPGNAILSALGVKRVITYRSASKE